MSRIPASDLAAQIGKAIMQWQDMTSLFDAEVGERLKLSMSERQCLACLTLGPRPAREIANATRLTRAAVTTLLDRLEERGLVRRTPDAHDRRQVLVVMTAEAKRLTMRYYGPVAAAGAEFLGEFSREQLATILAFVEGATALQQDQIDRLRNSKP